MNTIKKVLNVTIVMFTFSNLFSQSKETVTYIETPFETLKMDIYTPKKAKEDKFLSPLVIYVHGGGFSDRDRKDGANICKFLADQNVVAVTIDYSLYMQDKDYGCNGITSEKIKAIQIVSNQIWQATSYLLKQSDSLKFNKRQIFIAGTSAGGESALHAAYFNRNQLKIDPIDLPLDFKYAGIISGAGAIMDLNLITKENRVPMFLFHGDKDGTVPYGTGSHRNCPPNSTGWLTLFGSQSIAKYIERIGGSCQLFTIKDGTHAHGDTYFYYQQFYIKRFIDDVLLGDQFLRYETKSIVKK